MRDLSYINSYYESYNEEGRLTSRHGSVEFFTTMKFIHDCLRPGMRVCEVGAGTGRYTLALAKEGYEVSAIELVEHNLDILKSGIQPGFRVNAEQGDALDLSRFPDNSFDLTLVLGPMYHLYNDEDKVQALREAVRITKKGGYILVAYCMNEVTVLKGVFQERGIKNVLAQDLLTEDYHCKSSVEEVFELVRTEDIARFDSQVDAERIKLIASDGPTAYMRDFVDSTDDESFALFLDYHFKTCERQDLIGASCHTVDILRKN